MPADARQVCNVDKRLVLGVLLELEAPQVESAVVVLGHHVYNAGKVLVVGLLLPKDFERSLRQVCLAHSGRVQLLMIRFGRGGE